MRAFNLAEGQSLQFGDITVMDVGEDEVLLRIDCPDGVTAKADNPNLVLRPEWLREWVQAERSYRRIR